MIYLVIVLCNATGTCKDLTTLVAPTPGASPVFECMRYGESEAAKMVAANPGWYIRRWVCSAKPPAQGA